MLLLVVVAAALEDGVGASAETSRQAAARAGHILMSMGTRNQLISKARQEDGWDASNEVQMSREEEALTD